MKLLIKQFASNIYEYFLINYSYFLILLIIYIANTFEIVKKDFYNYLFHWKI